MTTVVDPLGTPTVIFNRTGTAIVSLASGLYSTASGNDATLIPNVSGHTIALVSTHSTAGNLTYVVRLPAGCEIGDLVEVYCAPDSASPQSFCVYVLVPVGETLFNPSGTAASGRNDDPSIAVPGPGFGFGPGAIFRKTSATNWQVVGA